MSLPKPALDGDDSTEPPVPRPQLGADVSRAGDKPTFLLETSGLGAGQGLFGFKFWGFCQFCARRQF